MKINSDMFGDEEVQEWKESLDYIIKKYGGQGAESIIRILLEHSLRNGVVLNESTLNTPYINSISPFNQPLYPGDIELEKKIENIVRWNAMAMVLQAYDSGKDVGGHIATYASAAAMIETGFNHCFRAKDDGYGGDMVLPQPHAAPGIYARAFLEGRLTEENLKNFRREHAKSGGLSSYPHPRSMPNFWEMPSASMGLSTVSAIYQARFAKYLENRGLKSKNGGKIWCFIGDGESDEPEVLGTVSIASRENLDNIILVVNCNLQRLDGPVRGNGKIIQELERMFRGADWNVIKVIWGSGWDALLANDVNGVLRRRMEECLDGDYQRYSILNGNAQREHWTEDNPELEKMMNALTDKELQLIKRGGQDPKKIYAAYLEAINTKGKPTVILIKSVKGDGFGNAGQGHNTAHQKKKLDAAERIKAARDYGIPISDEEAASAVLYKPPNDSKEMSYLHARRQDLGGYLPQRNVVCPSLEIPDINIFENILSGSGDRFISTTMVYVRVLSELLKVKNIGRYIVPIVPDEARTFGMESLFSKVGIYAPEGQHYIPVDKDSLLNYRESKEGQILQEGICEAGSIASFMAAGTAYAVHGLPMIPFYTFYSMFGFQRVGDMIWACGDMLTRGFLVGGTAGRTTLNGEGMQHQDGQSPVYASVFPSVKSYDPAFGYEIAAIVREGIKEMYSVGNNVMYYLTVYNENVPMPPIPEKNKDEVLQGIIDGGYLWKKSGIKKKSNLTVHLLSSGSIMFEVIKAQNKLEEMGIATHVWSITSFTELTREAQNCDQYNMHHPFGKIKEPIIQKMFKEKQGVCVAVTDYIKALPDSISKWMPLPYMTLGTDGFGFSESREKLRAHFQVDESAVVRASLMSLYRQNIITGARLKVLFKKSGLI